MVRFRPRGERSSTTEEGVAGESVPIADRWPLGKGLALRSSREIAIVFLRFAFALSARPPESPTTCLSAVVGSLAKRLPRHLMARWPFGVTWWTISQPTAHCLQMTLPSSGATSIFDLCLSTSAPAVALAPAKVGQTLLLLVRRLGACAVMNSSGTRLGRIRPFGVDATATGGDGSTFFASNAGAATQCDARSNPACGDLVSDDCASGFDVVASLGRRRTSTVNEGTARLNVVLDTAHRSADSSRRRRPCEAKRNKAIGDYWGDKRAISGDERARLVAREPLPPAATFRIA